MRFRSDSRIGNGRNPGEASPSRWRIDTEESDQHGKPEVSVHFRLLRKRGGFEPTRARGDRCGNCGTSQSGPRRSTLGTIESVHSVIPTRPQALESDWISASVPVVHHPPDPKIHPVRELSRVECCNRASLRSSASTVLSGLSKGRARTTAGIRTCTEVVVRQRTTG